MPLQQTSGNVTADAYGGGVAAEPNYIESVFSTYLYTGTGATVTQTIPNGIDESGKGALTWFKKRSTTSSHFLFDTNRGTDSPLATNSTSGQGSGWSSYFNFLSNGVSVSDDLNVSGTTYASWTFRKQPKFFDVVTWTGNGVAGRQIAHNLGSVPGCIFVKRTSNASNWPVYHRSTGNTKYLILNATFMADNDVDYWYSTTPTSTTFTVNSYDDVNGSGYTYVAYLYAHDAGGFGLTGTDNVISCGSYTGNGGLNSISLGYEAQWVMIKNATTTGSTSNWGIYDNMRGMPNGTANTPSLNANTSGAEASSAVVYASATGFTINDGSSRVNGSGETYIYIAIRRGPMKVPTDGTSVYATDTLGGSSGGTAVPAYRSPFPVDWAFEKRTNGIDNWIVNDRLRGINSLEFNLTDAEALYDSQYKMDFMNGWVNYTGSNSQYRSWMFRRAPSFFDEVCYTGTGSATTQSHNLGVAPEMIIIKKRSASGSEWPVYVAPLGATKGLYLGTTGNPAITTSTYWNNTAPTSSVFTVGNASAANQSGATYVAYLFATCAGVSKVGSYTGNGSSQTINCGFTSGARFVLIKNTDTTGEWYVYDTARGMISGTDPYLALNLSSAENFNGATTGCTTTSTGFTVIADGVTGLNSSGYNYIYLAIA